LIPLVRNPHLAVLYAHNNVLETYTQREAGRVLGRCYRIVCVSEYTAARASARLPRHLHDVIRVVPNGVDRPDGDLPRRGISDQLRVVFLGRVIPEKGPHVVVEAVSHLQKCIHLTVVGSAGFSAGDALTTYERRLRVSAHRRASFVPFQVRSRVPEILSGADVVVIPSLIPEAFPLVALEAMAAGAVVIASDIGGLPEAVGDAGFLFPPGDASVLAEVLEGLASSQQLMEKYRQLGYARAQSMDWSVISRRLEEALA
jgi:glycosyltransferase involved in cell wall biosynthesis